MNKIDLSASSILFASVILAILASFIDARIDRSDIPLKCHVCDPDTCRTFDKNAEPKECTVDDLNKDNIGPSKLSNFSYIPFSPLVHLKVPEFLCQKIEAYDVRGKFIVRKCQLKLSGNESCADFYRNLNKDVEKTYTNATCHLCDREGCNSSGFVYIWAPLVLSSIMLCLYMK